MTLTRPGGRGAAGEERDARGDGRAREGRRRDPDLLHRWSSNGPWTLVLAGVRAGAAVDRVVVARGVELHAHRVALGHRALVGRAQQGLELAGGAGLLAGASPGRPTADREGHDHAHERDGDHDLDQGVAAVPGRLRHRRSSEQEYGGRRGVASLALVSSAFARVHLRVRGTQSTTPQEFSTFSQWPLKVADRLTDIGDDRRAKTPGKPVRNRAPPARLPQEKTMLARMQKSLKEKDQGFTLIELLVVIVIIGILAAIAIPIFLNQQKKGVDAGDQVGPQERRHRRGDLLRRRPDHRDRDYDTASDSRPPTGRTTHPPTSIIAGTPAPAATASTAPTPRARHRDGRLGRLRADDQRRPASTDGAATRRRILPHCST